MGAIIISRFFWTSVADFVVSILTCVGDFGSACLCNRNHFDKTFKPSDIIQLQYVLRRGMKTLQNRYVNKWKQIKCGSHIIIRQAYTYTENDTSHVSIVTYYTYNDVCHKRRQIHYHRIMYSTYICHACECSCRSVKREILYYMCGKMHM